jgi:hypothetical protein
MSTASVFPFWTNCYILLMQPQVSTWSMDHFILFLGAESFCQVIVGHKKMFPRMFQWNPARNNQWKAKIVKQFKMHRESQIYTKKIFVDEHDERPKFLQNHQRLGCICIWFFYFNQIGCNANLNQHLCPTCKKTWKTWKHTGIRRLKLVEKDIWSANLCHMIFPSLANHLFLYCLWRLCHFSDETVGVSLAM